MSDGALQQLYVEQVPGFGAANAGLSNSPAAKALGNGKRLSTGSIFFKTKLCSRFRAGNCPYNTNCNFAHGMEELRKPPPGWEEFVNPPLIQDASKDGSQKHRPCKKFFAEGICPYGERCIFSHEDPALKPAAAPAVAVGAASNIARPPNWKTRLCNKWEITGYCPFGEKCHFAHGAAELQKYVSGAMESPFPQTDGIKGQPLLKSFSDPSATMSFAMDSRQSFSPQKSQQQPTPPPQPSIQQQQQQPKPAQLSTNKPSSVWRGPTEGITTVYGDWLEENDDSDDEQDEEPEEPEKMLLF